MSVDSPEPSAYSIKIDIPEQSDGYGVQIPGLGTFQNGSTYEVTQAEADAYRSYHTKMVTRYNDKHEIVGADAELGPTLAEAAESMYGVIVTDSSGTTFSQDTAKPSEPTTNADTTQTNTTSVSTTETPTNSTQTTGTQTSPDDTTEEV